MVRYRLLKEEGGAGRENGNTRGEHEIHGSVLTEHSIALENSDGLIACIGDSNLGDMSGCAGNLNGDWACSEGCTSKGNDGEEVEEHS